jgi:hypothetical protein
MLCCRFAEMQRLVRVKGVLMSQWDLIMLLKMQLLHWMDRLVTIISNKCTCCNA